MGLEQIEKCLDKIKDKKIIIFGAAERAKTIDEILKRHSLEIAYFVDNDPKRENEYFLTKKIYNPLNLLYENSQDIFILVAIKSFDEIYEQLSNMGFTENTDFICPLAFFGEGMSGSYKKCNRIDPHLGYSRSDDVASFTVYGDVNCSDAIRIVALGGSTTDSTVSRIASWPEMLYGILKKNNIKAVIYNGGIVSYGVAQEFLKLTRDVMPLNPDIILSLNGVNDVGLRTSVQGHPMVHIYQDIIFKHIMSKQEQFFCGGINTNIRESDYGIYSELDDCQHWINCVRMMYAVTKEFDVNYLCFLQPMLGIGKYCLNAREKRMLEHPDEEVKCRYGLHEKLVNGVVNFYNGARMLADKYEYIIDIAKSFDNLSDIYTDLSHVNEQGNRIIAENIFNELIKRGLVHI